MPNLSQNAAKDIEDARVEVLRLVYDDGAARLLEISLQIVEGVRRRLVPPEEAELVQQLVQDMNEAAVPNDAPSSLPTRQASGAGSSNVAT